MKQEIELNPTARQRRRLLQAAGATALGGALPSMAGAQSDWPAKQVRMVVPFPAGGGADLGARAVATHLGNAFGKPVVIDNRAGADGVVAAMEVLKSPPDGYTLFFGTATAMSYTPSVKKAPPYDPVADFTPISNFCIFTFYLMVSPSVPGRNLEEFLGHVRANPGKLAYGTGNSTGILAMAQLMSSAKLDMVHVPYKGESQAVVDMIGGRVAAMWATPAVMPQLLKENFRPLAVLLPNRTSTMPEVPTIAEAGQPLVDILPWGGLFAPRGLPRPLVDRISKDFGEVMRKQEVITQYEKLGLIPTPSSPEAAAKQVRDQLVAWNRATRTAGIVPE